MAKVYSTDLIGKKESVVDELLLLNQHQTPLINLIGFGAPVTNVEHVWFEDSLYADESTTTAAALVGATSVVVADAEPFRAGHVIKIGDELLKVTAVNAETKTLTVTRGYASTTAAAVAEGAKVEVLFVEGAEGQAARDARYKARKRVSNLTQIFDDSVELSGTAVAVSQYGVADEYEKEKQKKQLELALSLEKALIGGVKYENGVIRQMSGIRSFIKTNVDNANNTALTAAKINNLFQKIFENGGFDTGASYKILVPAKQKVAISNFGASELRLDRQDNGRGQVVDFFVSDFGSAEIVLDNNLSSDELVVIDTNRTKIRPLQGREFSHTYLGTQGDYIKGMLVGEYTLEFAQEAAHGRIKGLA